MSAVEHRGGCHCSALRFHFHSAATLAPRACQCGFCRRHGARTVSDAGGVAIITLDRRTTRYRFGTGTTEFLVCGSCGVYVAALTEVDGAFFATLNLNAFDDPRLDLSAAPVCYDGETAEAKAERRRRNWTPTRLRPA